MKCGQVSILGHTSMDTGVMSTQTMKRSSLFLTHPSHSENQQDREWHYKNYCRSSFALQAGKS